jgi:hypothetical protein
MACRGRENLLDDEIMQGRHADWLSDASSDCESVRSSNDDNDVNFGPSASQKGRKRVRLDVSDSDVNIDDDNDVSDGWSNDDLRSLEQFLGNTSLTFTPNDPTSISEVVM